MKRLNKFRGIIEFDVRDEHIVLSSLTMNDVFNMIQLSNSKKNELANGVSFFSEILYRSYPSESLENINTFVLTNYSAFVDGLVIALGWTTEEKLKESKEVKEKGKKKMSMALFKARMASNANKSTVEDKYITNCYIVMRKFKYTFDTMLNMNVSHFDIIIEEMISQGKREEAEINKNKTLR